MKTKKIAFQLTKPNKAQYEKLGPLADQVRRVFKRNVKMLKKHFEEDGWDIDSSSAFEEALYDVFGTHLSTLFLQEVVGSGIATWEVKENGVKGVYRKVQSGKKTKKRK